MTSHEKHEYHNIQHGVIETTCHLGEELHAVTSNAFGDRVLNIRMFRVIPSKTGHTGYTRVGFFLTRNEARHLRDTLSDIVEDDGAWEIVTSEPIKEGIE